MTRTQASIGTIVFFFAAPGIMGGLIPWWISGWRMAADSPLPPLTIGIGVLILIAGLLVLIDSFARFARSLGTPAPVAPTQSLVVDGWYRFVRNPMYVAVTALIVGQALLFWSWPLAVYAGVFLVVVHTFVVAYEEPALKEQFPADYPAYFAAVPRWLPRLTPWRKS